jgi:hypothetical protein
MRFHILNGDSLAYSFPDTKIPGEVVVVREALIDGELSGDSLQEFWQTRARSIDISIEEYHNRVVTEFEKIMSAPPDTEFNLWFEYDLFCQVNMWFVLSIINSLPAGKKVFAVYTTYLNNTDKNFWNGYGPAATNELLNCYANKIELNKADLQFGEDLWKAYKNNELEKLSKLSIHQSPAFPHIQEVIKAHIDRFPGNGEKGRPEKVLEDITKTISTDFNKVFSEFWKRESIYGFGDLQLKKIYDEVMNHQ